MEEKFLGLMIEAIEIEGREIGIDDEFRSYDEWDSLALLSVIAILDEEYGVIIDSEDFEKLQTLKDIYNFVSNE